MSVRIDPQVEAMIRRKVEAGLYDDTDAVLHEALRLLDEQDRRLHRLRAAIAEGEVGEGIRFTPDLVAEMKQDAERMAREGIEPDPDVCG